MASDIMRIGRGGWHLAGAGCHLSVAICTWNRCELLSKTLQSLTRVRLPAAFSWELLVVNNNCTDATDQVVEAFAKSLPLRLLHEPRAGLSHARNRALLECRAAYLLFTDDDVQVDAGWVTAFVDAVRQYPNAPVFGGPVEPWFQSLPDPELVAAFPAVRNGFCGVDHERPLGPLPEPLRVTGANMAFKVAALGELRFDPALGVNQETLGGGEETALIAMVRARGGEVIWVPEMRLRHYVDPSRMQIGYLIRLARDRGRSSIREKGAPLGTSVAGVPLRLVMRLIAAGLRAGLAYVKGQRVRAAGHYAKCESYRAKIVECRALVERGKSKV